MYKWRYPFLSQLLLLNLEVQVLPFLNLLAKLANVLYFLVVFFFKLLHLLARPVLFAENLKFRSASAYA
jgi:hypothetical protein